MTSSIKEDIKIKTENKVFLEKQQQPIQAQPTQVLSRRRKLTAPYATQRLQKTNIYSVYDCQG